MPYIKQDRREILARREEGLFTAANAGELNYQFTMLAIEYFRNHKANYAAINDVVGALEGAKLEFYRRVAAPYEDTKIKENGDVL